MCARLCANVPVLQVRLDGLPPDATVEEVGSHCARFGDIMMVELCRSCDDLVTQVGGWAWACVSVDVGMVVDVGVSAYVPASGCERGEGSCSTGKIADMRASLWLKSS